MLAIPPPKPARNLREFKSLKCGRAARRAASDRGPEARPEAFSKTGSWVIFYREMLGRRRHRPKPVADNDEMRYFETTPEFAELQEMVAAVRSQDTSKGDCGRT